MSDITNKDRDLMIRTVIGEADDQPDVGKAAVAHVILNRLNDGGYGKTVPDVLFAPKQFEPWGTRANRLMSYTDDNPSYQKAAKVVDDVLNGLEDPTNGATHFADVDTVRQRGNTSAMNWINGMSNVTKIGAHTFGNADAGRKSAKADNIDIEGLASKYGGAPIQNEGSTKPETETETPVDINALADKYGGESITQPATVKTVSSDAKKPEIFQTPVGPRNANMEPVDENGNVIAPNQNPRSINRLANAVSDAPQAILNAPNQVISKMGKEMYDTAVSSKDLAGSGLIDISQSRPAQGVGKIGLGLLSALTSPLTAASKTLVEDPVTNLTGNPDIGARAGLVAGSALPVGKAGSSIAAKLPTNQAIKDIAEAIGPENIPQALERMRANDRLSVLDVSPNTRRMGQKLILTEGDHPPQFDKFVKDRTSTAKASVTEAYNENMGAPVNVLDKLNEMKADAKKVGTTAIQPSIKDVKDVNVTPVIQYIDSILKPGVNSVVSVESGLPSTAAKNELSNVRKLLTNNKSQRTDAEDLHTFQSALRAKADDLLNSPDGSTRQVGKALMDVRNKIVTAIDEASPKITNAEGTEVGTYKTGLSKYRDEMQIQDAFDKGSLIIKNRPGVWDDRPEFWADWIKNSSKPELEAAKQGARVAVDSQLRGFKNGTLKGENVPEIEFNAEKFRSLFGEKETNKMIQRLQDEHSMAQTHNDLVGGSQTAARMKADSRIDLPEKKSFGHGGASLLPLPILEAASYSMGGPPLLTSATVLGGMALKKGANVAQRSLAKSKNSVLTELMTSTGPKREALMKELENYIPRAKLSIGQKARLALPTSYPSTNP